jgi:hypothetical protein
MEAPLAMERWATRSLAYVLDAHRNNGIPEDPFGR